MSDLAASTSTTTWLGPTPISQPSLSSIYVIPVPTFWERIYEDAIEYFLPNQLHRLPKKSGIPPEILVYSEGMDKKYFEKVILSHPKDNVATARIVIEPESLLALSKDKKIIVKEKIPFGHKIALRAIPKGGAVIKYGEQIGTAVSGIKPGEWVHIHNVIGERGKGKSRKKS